MKIIGAVPDYLIEIDMPFKKSGNKYKSPSGRTFTKKQVKMYYATDGFKKKPRKSK